MGTTSIPSNFLFSDSLAPKTISVSVAGKAEVVKALCCKVRIGWDACFSNILSPLFSLGERAERRELKRTFA